MASGAQGSSSARPKPSLSRRAGTLRSDIAGPLHQIDNPHSKLDTQDSTLDTLPVKQSIVTLDLEGVLTPEIWIAVAEKTGIPELRRTTRDEPDYDKLMRSRIKILAEHGLKLSDIQNVIGCLKLLPGAKEFLDDLRAMTQVII